ncbi:MAG: BlaI/MecI/CopY family transcriptional regulator [Planctomycetes bacterium]|nr:BlaI/MecI/CopY family transcriptional regulator [Planctomycetota bacterium]
MKFSSRSKSQYITVPQKRLGSVQLKILEVVWNAQGATTQDITRAIAKKRPQAVNTIPISLKRLTNKGLLSRTTDGKRFRYRATVSRMRFLSGVS